MFPRKPNHPWVWTASVAAIGIASITVVPSPARAVDPGETVELPLPSGSRIAEDCEGLANDCGRFFRAPDKAEIFAVIIGGSFQSISSSVTMFDTFAVSAGNERVLDARISGSVRIVGELVAPGVGGTGAAVTVTASLVDKANGAVVGSAAVFDDECAGAIADVCRRPVSATRNVSFGVKVVRGHEYELRLTSLCEAESGLLGVDVICAFTNVESTIFGNGFVQWDGFRVAIDVDLAGLIEDLQASVDMLKNQLSAHDASIQFLLAAHDLDVKTLLAFLQAGVDDNHEAILETIRLLHTPAGQRRSDFPACDGGGCDFPNGNGPEK